MFAKGGASPKGKERAMERYADDPDAMERGEAEDLEEAKRWEMEEQQVSWRPATIWTASATASTASFQPCWMVCWEVKGQKDWNRY